MNETHHNRALRSLSSMRTRLALRRQFSALLVRGSLPQTRAPLLVAVQHVSWWDPMVLLCVARARLDGRHVVLTDEPSLARMPFLACLDSFTASRRHLVGPMRRALAFLREPFGRLWLAPAGRIEHSDARQVECERLADWLAMRARVPAVAVAIRYDFGERRQPVARVSFGDPRMIERAGEMQTLLAREVERVRDDAVAGRSDAYTIVL